jgi:hypothetical protein
LNTGPYLFFFFIFLRITNESLKEQLESVTKAYREEKHLSKNRIENLTHKVATQESLIKTFRRKFEENMHRFQKLDKFGVKKMEKTIQDQNVKIKRLEKKFKEREQAIQNKEFDIEQQNRRIKMLQDDMSLRVEEQAGKFVFF